MTVLFNQWFPNSTSPSLTLGNNAYMNLLGNGSVSPVVVTPGSLELVPDPINPSRTVMKTFFTQQQTRFSDSALKVMLNPITPTASDPIIDWGAPYAGTRRWYRFSFMVTEWPEEPQHTSTSQLCVLWQLHDQKDNDPDVYVEPPLWWIDDGVGGWQLYNTVCPSAVTTTSPVNYTRRVITRIPKVMGQWEDIVIYMAPSWTTSGALKVWRNGNLIFNETGVANCINHQPINGGSFNFIEYGVYGGKTSQVTNRTAYHLGMQIGDEAYTTFNQFMSAVGSSVTENPYSYGTGSFSRGRRPS